MSLNNFKDQQSRQRRTEAYLLIGGVLLAAILTVSAMVNLPIFKFKEITVSGSSHLKTQEVIDWLKINKLNSPLGRFLGFNSVFAWLGDSFDLVHSPFVEAEADIAYFDRKLNVRLKDRERFAIWCRLDLCYWIDAEGFVFEPAILTEGRLINTVTQKSGGAPSLGARVIGEELFGRIKKILLSLNENGIVPLSINYDPDAAEFNIKTFNGPEMHFSIRFDPSLSLSAIAQLSKKIDFSKTAYLDFRVENKVYYKSSD